VANINATINNARHVKIHGTVIPSALAADEGRVPWSLLLASAEELERIAVLFPGGQNTTSKLAPVGMVNVESLSSYAK
jgi:hypothetical protein